MKRIALILVGAGAALSCGDPGTATQLIDDWHIVAKTIQRSDSIFAEVAITNLSDEGRVVPIYNEPCAVVLRVYSLDRTVLHYDGVQHRGCIDIGWGKITSPGGTETFETVLPMSQLRSVGVPHRTLRITPTLRVFNGSEPLELKPDLVVGH